MKKYLLVFGALIVLALAVYLFWSLMRAKEVLPPSQIPTPEELREILHQNLPAEKSAAP